MKIKKKKKIAAKNELQIGATKMKGGKKKILKGRRREKMKKKLFKTVKSESLPLLNQAPQG